MSIYYYDSLHAMVENPDRIDPQQLAGDKRMCPVTMLTEMPDWDPVRNATVTVHGRPYTITKLETALHEGGLVRIRVPAETAPLNVKRMIPLSKMKRKNAEKLCHAGVRHGSKVAQWRFGAESIPAELWESVDAYDWYNDTWFPIDLNHPPDLFSPVTGERFGPDGPYRDWRNSEYVCLYSPGEELDVFSVRRLGKGYSFSGPDDMETVSEPAEMVAVAEGVRRRPFRDETEHLVAHPRRSALLVFKGRTLDRDQLPDDAVFVTRGTEGGPVISAPAVSRKELEKHLKRSGVKHPTDRNLVNLLRHKYTEYEQAIRQVPREQYADVRNQTLDTISQAFPELARECRRQRALT